jgi:transcriptional regulator with XRE-family HTH domain
MQSPRTYSPAAVEAADLLGARIRLARIERRWTLAELAERVGVSPVTMRKIERGDVTAGIGLVFEAATLAGVPLFDADPEHRRLELRDTQARLALIPSQVRRKRRDVDVDF